MSLAALLNLEPAPIDGRFVRRVLLLNIDGREPPDRSKYRLDAEERRARRAIREAEYREKNRDKRVAYMQDYNQRKREERRAT